MKPGKPRVTTTIFVGRRTPENRLCTFDGPVEEAKEKVLQETTKAVQFRSGRVRKNRYWLTVL